MIVVRGWNQGFKKVGFTQMLRREFGYSLAAAKAATDAVLDNKSRSFPSQDDDEIRLIAQLTTLGAKVVGVNKSTSENVVKKPTSFWKKFISRHPIQLRRGDLIEQSEKSVQVPNSEN